MKLSDIDLPPAAPPSDDPSDDLVAWLDSRLRVERLRLLRQFGTDLEDHDSHLVSEVKSQLVGWRSSGASASAELGGNDKANLPPDRKLVDLLVASRSPEGHSIAPEEEPQLQAQLLPSVTPGQGSSSVTLPLSVASVTPGQGSPKSQGSPISKELSRFPRAFTGSPAIIAKGISAASVATSPEQSRLKQLEARMHPKQAHEHPTKLKRIVHSGLFEMITGSIILANTFLMMFEVEYAGIDLGYAIGYRWFDRPGSAYWPYAETTFAIFEVTFNIAFVVEFVMRVAADKWESCCSFWIWLDFVLVSIGVLHSFKLLGTNLDPTAIRVVRLARMVRTLKIVRTLNSFDSLFVLIRALQASVYALIWSFAVLLLIQVSVGMVMSQTLQSYMSGDADDQLRHRVFGYFGTFSRTIVTMFEITLGNWVPTCRLLIDNVSPYYMIFYLLYRCMFCFAVVKVIAAVFITETNKALAGDDEINMRKKVRSQKAYQTKVREMFEELDTSGDGVLTLAEFQRITQDRFLKSWSATLGIDTSDLVELFKLLDNGDGQITMKEFLDGLVHMSGETKKMDIAALMSQSDNINYKLNLLIKHHRVQSVRRTSLTMLKTGSASGFVLQDNDLPSSSPTLRHCDNDFSIRPYRRRYSDNEHATI